MKKKVYRFEWSDRHRRFEGPLLTAESERFKASVQQITRQIAEGSGIRKPRPIVSAVIVLLTILCGFTASFVLILNKQHAAGNLLLMLTPLCAFVAVALPMLRRKRVELVNAFIRRKHLEFQGLTRCDGFVMETYFFQSSPWSYPALGDSPATEAFDSQKVHASRSEFVGILEFKEEASTVRPNAILIKRNPTLQAGIFIKKLPSEEVRPADGEASPESENPQGKLYRIKNLKPRTVAIETRKDFEEEADWKISHDAPRKHNTSEPFSTSGFASRHPSKDESKEISSQLPHSTLKSEFSRHELVQMDSLENLKTQREVLVRDPSRPSEESFKFGKLTKKTQLTLTVSDEKKPDSSKYRSIVDRKEEAARPAGHPKEPAWQSPA